MLSTLGYTGASPSTMDFTIYRANPYPIELFRTNHLGISGKLDEKFTGYRRVIDVEFAPIGYDKVILAWLWGFAKGSARTVAIDGTTYNVTIVGDTLAFDFQQGTFFGDSFAIRFAEQTLSSITDTGSTRIFKPLYTPAGEGIVSETMSLYCNIADDIGIEVVKHDLDFLNRDKDDLSYAYRHVLTIDTGPIYKTALRNWLSDFVQWQHKQIDTTAIDAVNGQIYTVMFEGASLAWQLADGMKDIVQATLVFKEKTPRTGIEIFSAPIWDQAIFDSQPTA